MNKKGQLRLNKRDLTQQRFGMLVVVGRAGSVRDSRGFSATWECRCDCGKDCVRSTQYLKHSKKANCGCFTREIQSTKARERILRSGLSTHAVYGDYRRSARNRGLEWTLTESEFDALIRKSCRYCGSPPSRQLKDKYANRITLINGIDRIDNSKGYVPGNVCACCKTCNYQKRAHTEDGFKKWVTDVYHHYIVGDK
jgi:hypothetical protein